MKTNNSTVLDRAPRALSARTAGRPEVHDTVSEVPGPSRDIGCLAPVIGKLAAISEQGVPLVRHDATGSAAIPARTAVAITPRDIGREVVLGFEQGDPRKPILMALLLDGATAPADATVDVRVDGRRVTLSAKDEIVLSCGKASITLTRAGKVIIRGAYVLSRSSGVNRIKGGSVQIN